MSVEPKSMSHRLRAAAMTASGVILAVTPLALWVAWSETALLSVLATLVVAGGIFCLLVAYDKQPGEDTREGSKRRTIETLDDDFLSAMSNFGPWVYHHRYPGDEEFQRKMESLKKHGFEA
jgi:hypothetical protein